MTSSLWLNVDVWLKKEYTHIYKFYWEHPYFVRVKLSVKYEKHKFQYIYIYIVCNVLKFIFFSYFTDIFILIKCECPH